MITNNIDWKKNRNLHAILILDMVLNKKIESPYNKIPLSHDIPLLSKVEVKIKLTDKIKQFNFEPFDENQVIKYSDNYETAKIQEREKAEKIKINKILMKNSKIIIIKQFK
jgi:hypothetical protein